MKRLQGKIALITGASRGIGRAIAKKYADEGAELILVARSISGLEEVDDYVKSVGAHASLVPLDLSKDHQKIDELAAVIAKRFGKLDILIGNAAYLGFLSPIEHITPEIWDKTLATNLTANYRLLRAMEPLLKKSEAGNLIFLTSEAAHRTSSFWGAYAISKIGLETLVKIFAEENKKTKLRISIVDPGRVATNLCDEAMPGVDQSKLLNPEDITEQFVDLALSS